MRKLGYLLAALLLSAGINAQQITGSVSDNNGKALNGATISLLNAKDSSIAKLAATKDEGRYTITGIKPGQYLVSASYVGHVPRYSAPFEVASADVTVPALLLEKATGDMKNIVVTARKPIVEVKADKTILNVEGTINATGSDALELLRKSPGVLVDRDDNLSLSGKNGVQVYIDGRPSPLSGKDLSDYLKSLQSASIEAIEIITNPSARYEAAGNAGIINIRLKKNKAFGTNGSVNAGWNIATFAKYNAGFALNHRDGSVNVFGNYNYNHGLNMNFMNLDRVSPLGTRFLQGSDMINRNRSSNFKAGLDYFVSKKSTFGFIVNGNVADPEFSNYSRTNISKFPNGSTDSILIADNSSKMDRSSINTNLNYRYTDTLGRELNIDADYGVYNINNNQFQPNYTYNANQSVLLNKEVVNMVTPSDIRFYSLKIDHDRNLGKGRLSFGGKFSYANSDNTFERYNLNSAKFMEHINNFTYKENINALYVNYNRQLKGVMFQAGLRMENTRADGHSSGKTSDNGSSFQDFDSTLKRDYTNLFPSAALTFNKNPMSQLSITYSRRIDRPAYQDLNPFEFRLDKYTYMKGNTELRPQYTNIIGLTHSYKYKLTTSLTYSHVNDVFSQLIDVDPVDKSKSFMTRKNLATQDIISLNVSYPFQYKSFSSFANLNSYYSHYMADNGPGKKIDLDVVAASLYMQNTLRFAKTWTAELSGWFTSPSIWQGTFKSKSMGGMDIGLQKTLFEGKANIKASVSDVFQTMRWSSTSNYAGQTMDMNGGWESRQFRLNFSYRFGNNQVKAARQRNIGADEEKKRAEGGGGGIGQ
jgi:iron complex outermembrane receptor protein